MAMSLNRTLRVMQVLLGYAAEDYGVAALAAELDKPEHEALRLLLGQMMGDEIPIPEPPSQLAPFSTRGNEILQNGKPFKFVGCNMRGLAWHGTSAKPHANMEHFHQQLDTARDIGFKVVRFYAFHVDHSAETATDLVRRTLDAIALRGMFAIVCLGDCAGSPFYMRESEQNYAGGYTHRWYGGGYNDTYLPAVRKLVGAIGDHPAIFAWSPGNEFRTPFPPAPTLTQCQNMLEAFDVISTTIRGLSKKKLIITGLEHSYNLFVGNAYGGQQFSRKLYSLPNIDIASLHTYHDEAGHLYGSAYERIPHELAIQGIPKVVEETGLIPHPAHLYPVFLQNLVSATEADVSGWNQWGFSAPRVDIGEGGSTKTATHPGEAGMTKTCDHGGNCYQWDGLETFWSDAARRFATI